MDESRYIHGTSTEEQERLSLLNDLLNAASLRAMRLRPGDWVLDLNFAFTLKEFRNMIAYRCFRHG